MRATRTMEEPHARVVRHETKRNGMLARYLDSVTSHDVAPALNYGWIDTRIVRSIVLRSSNELELVTVQMAFGLGIRGNQTFHQFEGRESHKGWFPASPFLSTISTTSPR